MRRFVDGARRPLHKGWARNLSPSYRFQYQTTYAGSRMNLDSAEYANMTLHFIAWYEQALRAGMRPLPEADMRILRAWAARVQFGYWMHNGMLSWDSGLGFKRWMKAKTWAYAQQGLLAIASSPRFWLHPRQGAWAKYVLDRGLWQFAIRCEPLPPRHLPSVHLYDVGSVYQGKGSQRIYAARMGANAMRALSLGLADMDAETPPPFYSFDADVGPAEREHAALLHGDPGRQLRRGPLRRDRAGAAVRRAGRAGRRGRRAAAGRVRARAAAPGPQARARHAGRAARRQARARPLAARAGLAHAAAAGVTRTPARSARSRPSAASRAAARPSPCATASPPSTSRAPGP